MTPTLPPPPGKTLPGLVAMIGTPLILFGVTAYLIVQALSVPQLGCTDPKREYLPDFGLLLGAAAALLVGRYLGRLRDRHHWTSWQQQKPTQLVAALGLCALLLVAAIALFYEALGVATATQFGVASLEPITYYVRCAIYFDMKGHDHVALFTYVVLVLTGLVVGNWLWADRRQST
jgi:hypothetical protein